MLTEALAAFRLLAASHDHTVVRRTALRTWVRDTACAWRGHDLTFQIERGRRIYLRCVTCGHETPGWYTR